MKFVDLNAEYRFYKSEIDGAVDSVMESGRYLLGDQLKEFENRFAKLIGVTDAVGVKNCTDAIMLLVGNLLNDNKNAPIILPNFGAYPTAVACRNLTNNIHYVDVDRSMTIDVNKLPPMKKTQLKAKTILLRTIFSTIL